MTTSKHTGTPKSTTLVNYLELWTPAKDALVLDSAFALGADGPRQLSDGVSVPKGQGIAGSAWQQESPVIMQGTSAFLDEVSASSGLKVQALLAIPVYREFTLLNVLVLGLAPGNGGVEIWTRDDRDELSISGSYYDGLNAFEFISRYVRFPKGAGLPGSCWKTGRPRMIDGPSDDPDFIRSFDRDPARPTQCVGLPISREYGFPASILLLLSDQEVPLANCLDILRCDNELNLTETHSGSRAPWMQPLCGAVKEQNAAIAFGPGDALTPDGFRCGLAMPFFDKQQIEDVFVMLF